MVVVGIEERGERQLTHLGDGGEDVLGTLFEIGSITKTFTALLLADMVERGEVRFSDPVSTFLPEPVSNPALSEITLLNLASHTARLRRLPRDLWWRALRNLRDPYAGYDIPRLEASLTTIKARSQIGRKFHYSNFGFAILGHVLANAGGLAYEDLIVKRVCEPLGLSATSASPVGDTRDRYAQGHKKRGRPMQPWNLAAFAPAGVLKSSAEDMLNYLRAHIDPDSTPLADGLRAVQIPRLQIRRGRLAVGLAWLIDTRKKREVIWHNGGTGGFSAFAGFNPRARVGLVALANARVAGRLTRIGLRALEQLGS
jgi:D-alanyl-D-alanine-carboxypeptidase/D-alanyl-D-alanine-endopeptidase